MKKVSIIESMNINITDSEKNEMVSIDNITIDSMTDSPKTSPKIRIGLRFKGKPKSLKVHITNIDRSDEVIKRLSPMMSSLSIKEIDNTINESKCFMYSLINDLIPKETDPERETPVTYEIKYHSPYQKKRICDLLGIGCPKGKTYCYYPKDLSKSKISHWTVSNDKTLFLKYPIFIVSKGRNLENPKHTMTWDSLEMMGIHDYFIVVEQNQEINYRERFGDKVMVIPDSYQNSTEHMFSVKQRRYIVDYCNEHGIQKHWDMDDNISSFTYHNKSTDKPIYSKTPLHYGEYLSDKFTLSMMGFSEFGKNCPIRDENRELNIFSRVFSCMLIWNKKLEEHNINFRNKYNEDLDLNLQCLTSGLNILRTHQFKIIKPSTSNADKKKCMEGGNTEVHKNGGIKKRLDYIIEQYPKYVKECKRNSHSYDFHFQVDYKHEDFKHDIQGYDVKQKDRTRNNYTYVDFYKFKEHTY